MKSSYLHIETIIELLKQQEPERTATINHLENQAPCKWLKRAYIPINSSERVNQPLSECQIEESIVLEHEEEGDIVLDILKDGRVAGIEMISYIS
tara:strand:- start:1129 stop:1413 length:285 start_codon:yes stop_codon:yes gene_type:complete